MNKKLIRIYYNERYKTFSNYAGRETWRKAKKLSGNRTWSDFNMAFTLAKHGQFLNL